MGNEELPKIRGCSRRVSGQKGKGSEIKGLRFTQSLTRFVILVFGAAFLPSPAGQNS